jgi:TRAP-type uncharacterized transport system substrate-binding protein
LATGTASGTYVLLGAAIAKSASNRSDTRLAVCTSGGSIQNLELLQAGKVQFALVQLDTLHYAIHEGRIQRNNGDRPVRLVTFLYSEKLHVFVRPHLYLNSPADFSRFAGTSGAGSEGPKAGVWLGPPGSGGRDTASKVLEAVGLADSVASLEWRRRDRSWNIAAHCLGDDENKTLKAYFRTMAVPKQARQRRPQTPKCPTDGSKPAPDLSVDDLLAADAQLMPLSAAVLDRLTEDGLYVRTSINLGNYRNLRRGVPTIGIPTVLLTNLPDEDKAVVDGLIGALKNGKAAIEEEIDGIELDQFDRRFSAANKTLQGIEPHPGARTHLQSTRSRLLWIGLFALGLFVAAAWRNPRSLRRGLAAGSYLWILSASLTGIWILLSLAMKQVEGRLNPEFATLTNSLLNTLGIVTRLGEHQLMTREGEIWRWLGLFLFPVILGWLFSDVVKELFRVSAAKLARVIERSQARDAYAALVDLAIAPKRLFERIVGNASRQDGPLVFLNWNNRAERIASDFLEDAASAHQRIVVVLPDGSEPTPGTDRCGIRVVTGDPTARETMEKAGIADASAVTIVSAWAPADPHDRRKTLDPDAADTKTILAILAIRVLCEDRNRSRPLPITAEIRLARNREEARHAVQGGKLSLTCLAL